MPAKPIVQPTPAASKADTPVPVAKPIAKPVAKPVAKPIAKPVQKADTGSGGAKIDLGLNVADLPAKPVEGDFSKLMSLGDSKPVEKSAAAPIIVTTDSPKKPKKKAGWKNRAKKLSDDQEDEA